MSVSNLIKTLPELVKRACFLNSTLHHIEHSTFWSELGPSTFADDLNGCTVILYSSTIMRYNELHFYMI